MSAEGGGSGGGGAMQAWGGVFSAVGALHNADEQAMQLNDEADTQEQNARLALLTGKYNANRQAAVGIQKIGEIKADYGASNISQDSGSVMDILRQSHINAEMDRLAILHGAKVQATEARNRAAFAREGAKSARRTGEFNAFTSLFSSAAKANSYGGGSSGGGSSSGSVLDSGSASSMRPSGGSF